MNEKLNILGELTEKRSLNCKHYRLENGELLAVCHAVPVHYEEDGHWLDIDNRLDVREVSVITPSGVRSQCSLVNRANSFRAVLPAALSEDSWFTMEHRGFTLSFRHEGIQQSNAVSIPEKDPDDPLTLATRVYTDSLIHYSDVLPGVNMEYAVRSCDVKERIFFTRLQDISPVVSFLLYAPGLGLTKETDGTIRICNGEEDIFLLPSPFMLDAADSTGHVEVSAEEIGDALYRIIYTPDRDWLEDAERIWPVVLDPTIAMTANANTILDGYVVNGSPEYTYLTAYRLYSGYYSARSTISRGFISHLTLPGSMCGDSIIRASLRLYGGLQASGDPLQVNIQPVTSVWENRTTLTWNNQPSVEEEITDYQTIDQVFTNNTSGYYWYWDVSSAAQRWYAGDLAGSGALDKHGFRISSPSSSQLACFVSADGGDSNTKPQLYIYYRNMTGLESYYDYTTADAGRAGTLSVSNYTGHPVMSRTDMSYSGSRMPVSMAFHWNLNTASENIGFGRGWRCCYAQKVEAVTVSGIAYYCRTDGDGTKLFFTQQSGVWKDENGLGYTLSVLSSGYEIKDRDNNTLTFNSAGNLTKITDGKISSNYIQITYSGGKISVVRDGANRKYHFTYNVDGDLEKIEYKSTGTTVYETVSYTYSSHALTQVTYADGNTAAYTYSSRKLTKATGCMGDSVTLAYGSGEPARVSTVTKKDGSTVISSASFLYGKAYTKVTDNNGRYAVYQFNNMGNTTAVYNKEGQALFGSFKENKPARLVNSSRLQDTVVNLLTTRSHTADWTEDITVTSGKVYTVSGTGTGTVTLTAGTATATTGAVDNARREATLTVPSGCTTLTITGTGSFTDLQLEKTSAASRYNLLKNTDITAAGTWTGVNTSAGDGRTAAETGARASLDKYSLLLNGSAGTKKAYTQTITLSGSSGDNYTFGGWVKCVSVPLDDTRRCGIEVTLLNGSTEVTKSYIAANDACREWQFLSGRVQAAGTYTKVKFAFVYEHNENRAYFDGAQLFKERFAYIRHYTDDGRVDYILDLDGNRTRYEYRGSSGDITKITLPNNAQFTYSYDSTTNLLTGTTSSTGVKTSHSYDVYGNSTQTQVTYENNEGPVIQSDRTYTGNSNLPASVTTGDRNTTANSWDVHRSLLNSVTDPNGNTVSHTYDSMKRPLSTSSNGTGVSYTYSGDRLSKITHAGTEVNLAYTTGGLVSTVKIGSAFTLVQNGYNTGTWTLASQLHGNGHDWRYLYNTHDELTRKYTVDGTEGIEFRYYYRSDGHLSRIGQYRTVIDNGTVTSRTGLRTERFYYDTEDRLTACRVTGSGITHEFSWEYDSNNNVISLKESINGIAIQSTNRYNGDRQPTGSTFSLNGSTAPADAITYDSYGRLSTRTEGSILTTSCTYRNVGTACTTTQVETLRNRYNGTDHDLHYTYDPNGNILSVSDGTYTTSYTYDGLNQLIWEYNEQEQKAWQHAYDLGGNITSVTEYPYTENGGTWVLGTGVTTTYTYGNSTWKDLLTGYNGSAVTYDASGNMLTCNGKSYVWQGGHRLKSMTAGSTSLTFEYNADGLRWKKTGGSTTHLYFYRGTKLAADKTGSDTLLFRYDSQGNILGFTQVTASSTEHYTYVKSLQGDILGILNGSGTEIASYTYDAWGRVLTVTGTDLALAERNPIRYRGYYYDSESQLYYLQSRYYDPELKRFISPDSYAQTYDSAVGANMFAYCNNRPTVADDDEGEWLNIVIGAVVGGAISALTTYAQTGDVKQAAIAGAVGAVSGAIAATGWPMIKQATWSAATTCVGEFFNQIFVEKRSREQIDYVRVAGNTAKAFVVSVVGSKLGELADAAVTHFKSTSNALASASAAKSAAATARSALGKGHSALSRQAARFAAKSKFYQNTYQGFVSVVGSIVGGVIYS